MMGGIDRLQRISKHRVEDVVYPRATTEFLGRNIRRRPIDRRDERRRKAGHQLKDQRPPMFLPAEMHVSVASQLLLRLTHEGVQPSLDVRQTFPNVGHQRRV